MAISVIKDATKQLARRWSSTPLRQQGKIGYILAWLIGVPIPILILVYSPRGGT
jgi:hypothetical protein